MIKIVSNQKLRSHFQSLCIWLDEEDRVNSSQEFSDREVLCYPLQIMIHNPTIDDKSYNLDDFIILSKVSKLF